MRLYGDNVSEMMCIHAQQSRMMISQIVLYLDKHMLAHLWVKAEHKHVAGS
jgi:hypothetical protein